jgi:hypothetical protein
MTRYVIGILALVLFLLPPEWDPLIRARARRDGWSSNPRQPDWKWTALAIVIVVILALVVWVLL